MDLLVAMVQLVQLELLDPLVQTLYGILLVHTALAHHTQLVTLQHTKDKLGTASMPMVETLGILHPKELSGL
jgi:hypothetical protein